MIEEETKLEFTVAATYLFGGGWAAGVEVVNKMGLADGSAAYSALCAGSVRSYARDQFWTITTLLPQIVGLKGSLTRRSAA